MFMKFSACVVFQHGVPRRLLFSIFPKVWDDLSCKDFDCCSLSYPILSKHTSAATFFWNGEPIKPEAVFSELMYKLSFEFFCKSDDFDCLERTFIDADAAANTKFFGDDWFSFISHNNGFIASTYSRTEFDTFVCASL